MATLQEFRQKYPDYDDMSDGELASALREKYYVDVPQEKFASMVGIDPQEAAIPFSPDVPGTRPPADPRPPEVIEAEARTAQDEAQRLITEQDARPTPGLAPTPDDPFAEQRTRATEEAIAAPPPGAIATERLQPRPAEASIDLAPVARGAGKGVVRALGATGALALKAGEAAAGQPPGAPPTPAGEFAEKIERNLAEMPHEPGGAGLIEGLTQFLLPFGALTKSAGVIAKGRPIVQTALASGATGATAFSGQQARLSDLVQQHPRLKNPVTEFLASDPDDGFKEGRLKNALEFAGLDVAIALPFVVAMRGIRGAAALGKQDGNVAMAEALEKVKPGTPAGSHAGTPIVEGKVKDAMVKATGHIARFVDDRLFARGLFGGEGLIFNDKTLRPLMSRVEAIGKQGAGKRVAKRLNEFELEQNLLMGKHFRQVEPFLLSYRKMSKADRKLFDKYAKNSEMSEAYDVLRRQDPNKIPGIKREFDQLRDSLDDMHKLAVDNGLEVPYRKHYLPRIVRDYDGLRSHLGAKSDLERMIAKSGAEKGSFDEREVIREWLEKQFKGDGRPGFVQGRVIDKLDDDMLKFYGGFEDTIQNYVRNLTYRVAKNRFVGTSPQKAGYQDEITKLLQRGKITEADGTELKRLVDVRLKGGEQSLGPGMRTYRDLVYLSSIGNPISTITQTSEYLLNAHRHGLFNVGKTTGQTFKRTGLRMEDLGLDDIAAEFANPMTLSGAGKDEAVAAAINKSLRWTMGKVQFKRMDELMKEGNLNAAFAKAKNLVKDTRSKAYQDFAKEQAQYFGPETKKLIDALKRGDAKDQNVKLYLYEQLAKTQPISLSEMPEQYLKMKNGRAFYFLKSFGLKQLETTRRDVLRKLASGNKEEVKEGMKQAIRLGGYFGGGITGTNLFKDWLLDRDPDAGEAAVDALLTLFGLSRYAAQKFTSKQKTRREQALVDIWLPPKATEFTEIVISTAQGDPSTDLIEKQLPIGGKILSEHFGAAAQKKKKRKGEARRSAEKRLLEGPPRQRMPK